MKAKLSQQFYVLTFALIFCFAISSCGTMHRSNSTSIINYYNFKEEPLTDKRNFVIMNDSSVLFGTKVTGWTTGAAFGKKTLDIDGKQIQESDVLAYQNKNGYYARIEKGIRAERYIAGRISVYEAFLYAGTPQAYSIVYFQKSNGPIKECSINEIRTMLRDCETAYDMINIPDADYAKILRKQPFYLQTIIDTYNSCGEWK